MKPILFYINNQPIYSYSFFIFFALLSATIGFIISGRKERIKISDGIYLGMLCFIGGIIFSRVVSILSHPDIFIQNLKDYGLISIFSRKGFSFHGAVIGVIVFIYYFSREIKFPPLKLLDLISPFAALSYAIGRLGCFFNGCCSGIRSSILFSVIYPKSNLHPEYLSVHPVQLYDSYLNFLLFLFLFEYKDKKRFEGELFLLFLLGNSAIRFFVEYFRWEVSTQVVLNFITLPQIVSIAIIIISIIGIKKWMGNET